MSRFSQCRDTGLQCVTSSLEAVCLNRNWIKKMSRQFLPIMAVGLLLAGCSLTLPVDSTEGTNHSDTAVQTCAADIWTALAKAVQAKTIGTSSRLSQYVLVLARNGDLSDRDVAAFDAAFPKIATSSRELTDVDIQTLFDLGRKAKP
jgi:hypothetical protein